MKYVLLLFVIFLLAVIAYLSKPSDARCIDEVANVYEKKFMEQYGMDNKDIILVRNYVDSVALDFSGRLTVKDRGFFKVVYYNDDSIRNSRVGIAALKKVWVAE